VNKVLLDTDIFSRVLRRYSPVIVARSTAYLANFDRFTISAITVTEIVRGWHKQQREDRVLQFIIGLSTVEVLVLDLDQYILAGRILADLERTGQPIGLADTMIAAIAIQQNITLITGNQSHYRRISALGYDLRLDCW
jgi:tRNA(fMet)-specific endonuclease VapC